MTLRAVKGYQPTPADLALEAEIKQKMRAFQKAMDRVSRQRLWEAYTEAHARRSDGMVRHLEERRGLLR